MYKSIDKLQHSFLDFNQPFYDYYGYVYQLCAFLTFRNRISFESMHLLFEGQQDSREICADCYVKSPNNFSQRNIMHVIDIHRVDDTVFKNILKNIVRAKKERLPLLITPKDDADATIMNIEKVRNICSALEMEADLIDIKIKRNEELELLIEKLENVIREHREEKHSLSEKTYTNLFNSLAHWGQALSEKAWAVWKLHEIEVKPLCKLHDIKITQEMVERFVKARNDITHRGTTGIEQEVANTGYILLGLVYCCTLTRLGMKSEEIRNIMNKGLI